MWGGADEHLCSDAQRSGRADGAERQRRAHELRLPGQPALTQTFTYRGSELGQAVVVTGTTTYTDTYLYTQDGLPLELLRQQKGTTSHYW